MFYSQLAALILLSIPTVLSHPVDVEKRAGTDQTTFQNMAYYMKYASSSYSVACPKPNGNTLVMKFNNLATDTQGFIARDDTKKEIVCAFRGSSSIGDFAVDANAGLKTFSSSGVNAPAGTKAHTGFLDAYNSVAPKMLAAVKSELATHPDYKLVTTGHSLGGALSSIGAVSLKSNFPNSTVIMYSYGQPRTGNKQYVSMVNSMFPAGTSFRSVHTFDGVPTILPATPGGYQHHGTEYWTRIDPATTTTVKTCSGNEDITCSAAILSSGINVAHLAYYNAPYNTPHCT